MYLLSFISRAILVFRDTENRTNHRIWEDNTEFYGKTDFDAENIEIQKIVRKA